MNTTFPDRLSPALLAVLAELGFTGPTPVQVAALPPLLDGRDLIGRSKTGSGKTLAFALPILQRLRMDPPVLQALVLAPTRELCAQVAREIRKFGRRSPELRVICLTGGEPLRPQAKALEVGVHIAVGTPGRILDHLQRETLDLRQVRTVVLDEADRMLDMGFEDDMRRVLDQCPPERQTALFSATFPAGIAAISQRWQRDPVRVEIEEDQAPASEIRQIAVSTTREERTETLLAVLARHKPASTLVFCNLKVTASDLAEDLHRRGVSASALHGDLEQRDRDLEMAKLRNGSVRVLVATDVAARGLDVADLDLVVNYDVPPQPEVYVHRVGRTGRAGRTGLAVTLVAPEDLRKLGRIEEFTGATLERHAALAPAVSAPVEGASMRTLKILGGRKDKVRPGDILGALTGDAGISGTDVGKIEIHDHFAYVAVASAVAREALTRLSAGKIKGRRFRVEAVG